jgi:hypothetical protein
MTSLAAPGTAQPRRAATVALAVMAAAVLVWLAAAWQWHDAWLASRTLDAAYFLPPLVFIVVSQVYYLPLAFRRRPVAFEVHDGAFVAPAADRLSAGMAMSLLGVGAGSTANFLWPLSTDGLLFLVTLGRAAAVVMLAVWLLLIAAFARHTGRITLRPEGLRIIYAYGTRDVPWDAMTAGPPRQQSMLEPKLRIGRPDLVSATGLTRRRAGKIFLPTYSTWIRREFLLDAINYYLATPAARPTIGTAEGYTHLRRVLRAG